MRERAGNRCQYLLAGSIVHPAEWARPSPAILFREISRACGFDSMFAEPPGLTASAAHQPCSNQTSFPAAIHTLSTSFHQDKSCYMKEMTNLHKFHEFLQRVLRLSFPLSFSFRSSYSCQTLNQTDWHAPGCFNVELNQSIPRLQCGPWWVASLPLLLVGRLPPLGR